MPAALINPEKILGEKKGNTKSFQNFITGSDTPIGTNILKSASNNIVGFNRGKVNAGNSSLDIQSIIGNISTNILNSVNNSVEGVIGGIQSKLQENFTTVVNNFADNYKKKIQEKEDSSPKNILSNFLKLYKDAVGFITFFGNSRNIDRISKSLKSLRTIFNDSFEVAKIIRQTIQKIVKQLTNLPTSSGGKGGLNIDIDVPGGPLRQNAGGNRLSRFLNVAGKGALVAGGVAAAGLGISAASQYQREKLEESKIMRDYQPSILEEFADIFTKAINKFTGSLEGLFSSSTGKPSSSGSSSSGSSPSPSPSPSSPKLSPGDTKFNSAGIEKGVELSNKLIGLGFTPESASAVAGSAHYESAGFTADTEFEPNAYGTRGRGWIQWTGIRRTNFEAFAKKNNLDPKSDEANYRFLLYELSGATGSHWTPGYNLEEFKKIKDPAKAEEYFRLGYLKPDPNKANAAERLRRVTQINKRVGSQPQSTPTPPSTQPTATTIQPKLIDNVNLSESNTVNNNRTLAQSISTSTVIPKPNNLVPPPPRPGTKNEVNYVSLPDPSQTIDASTKEGQTSNTPLPPQSNSGAGVPFLSPSNPDNFYIHLSALTLNLVNR